MIPSRSSGSTELHHSIMLVVLVFNPDTFLGDPVGTENGEKIQFEYNITNIRVTSTSWVRITS